MDRFKVTSCSGCGNFLRLPAGLLIAVLLFKVSKSKKKQKMDNEKWTMKKYVNIRGLGFKFVDFGCWLNITAFIQYLMHYYKETKSPCFVFTILFKTSCAVHFKWSP